MYSQKERVINNKVDNQSSLLCTYSSVHPRGRTRGLHPGTAPGLHQQALPSGGGNQDPNFSNPPITPPINDQAAQTRTHARTCGTAQPSPCLGESPIISAIIHHPCMDGLVLVRPHSLGSGIRQELVLYLEFILSTIGEPAIGGATY